MVEWTAPDTTSSLILSGDVGLTACVADGSKDPCDGRVDSSGAKVTTRLVILQRGTPASGIEYCNVTYHPGREGRTTFIDRHERHKMVFWSASAPVSIASGCSRKFKIKIYVKPVSGSAVVVRQKSTIVTAVIPRS
ncbi:MAG: hypothetical protein GEU94_05660 [Micromonosporaceae bacterium]|nr:hypothetical protein [Micromonosporaceae bacterium]